MRTDYQNAIANNFSVENEQGVKINVTKPDDRLAENYTNKDFGWETKAFPGDIYISTPDETHTKIVAHYNNPEDVSLYLPDTGYPGVSGFFTDEATVSKHFLENNTFDSVSLGHDLQQAPHFDENKERLYEQKGVDYFPEYNGHLDCFKVNESKMQEHYGTTDFYAAMSQCKENTAWGEGGGTQGYNPFINEMINNGSLEYIPEKSRTCDNNACLHYAESKEKVAWEARTVSDYIENNKIKSDSNDRIGYNELSHSLNDDSSILAGQLPTPRTASAENPNILSGTPPDKEVPLDMATVTVAPSNPSLNNSLSSTANKLSSTGIT